MLESRFATIAIFTVHIASQWERDVILRFGAYNRMAGPGLYLTIPFIEHVALKADLRTMLTGFSAEEILTSDLVPVNVDAAIFWMIWRTITTPYPWRRKPPCVMQSDETASPT